MNNNNSHNNNNNMNWHFRFCEWNLCTWIVQWRVENNFTHSKNALWIEFSRWNRSSASILRWKNKNNIAQKLPCSFIQRRYNISKMSSETLVVFSRHCVGSHAHMQLTYVPRSHTTLVFVCRLIVLKIIFQPFSFISFRDDFPWSLLPFQCSFISFRTWYTVSKLPVNEPSGIFRVTLTSTQSLPHAPEQSDSPRAMSNGRCHSYLYSMEEGA